jgi:hypothetical protein
MFDVNRKHSVCLDVSVSFLAVEVQVMFAESLERGQMAIAAGMDLKAEEKLQTSLVESREDQEVFLAGIAVNAEIVDGGAEEFGTRENETWKRDYLGSTG